jgi:hypothetical protein
LLTLIGVLAVILVGIAVLLQLISIEEIIAFMGRALAIFVLMLVALCILKAFWFGVIAPWLFAAFDAFKTLIEWLLLILGLMTLSLVAQLALRRLGRHLTLRRDPQTGDSYGINDSKEAKN